MAATTAPVAIAAPSSSRRLVRSSGFRPAISAAMIRGSTTAMTGSWFTG